MEALQAVKDMFPRMSNSELMAPVDAVGVSTDKLRQQLLKEGVREAAIQESEQIMRNEFASLQNQLMLLKQKHRMLMDTLRQLEVPNMTCKKHQCSSSVAYVILNVTPLGIFLIDSFLGWELVSLFLCYS